MILATILEALLLSPPHSASYGRVSLPKLLVSSHDHPWEVSLKLRGGGDVLKMEKEWTAEDRAGVISRCDAPPWPANPPANLWNDPLPDVGDTG